MFTKKPLNPITNRSALTTFFVIVGALLIFSALIKLYSDSSVSIAQDVPQVSKEDLAQEEYNKIEAYQKSWIEYNNLILDLTNKQIELTTQVDESCVTILGLIDENMIPVKYYERCKKKL